MVSSGEVQSDAQALSSLGTNYTSSIDGLASSWKGVSYDSLNSQSKTVSSDFIGKIIDQFNSLATGCAAYENYNNAKTAYDTASGKYNTARINKDSSAMSLYSGQMDGFAKDMTKYKTEAISAFNSASSVTLEATGISVQDFASGKTLSFGSASGGVQNAIDWALAIAADDTHGYSQSTRYGNPNYDCSSLVIAAYDSAGFGVSDAGAGYTGNMRSAFTSVGFEWIPGNPDVNSLQPGDILLNEGEHTEMYIGDGMNVGAHGDKDGVNGDSSGQEISVSNYYSFPWDGVLRYTGTTNV